MRLPVFIIVGQLALAPVAHAQTPQAGWVTSDHLINVLKESGVAITTWCNSLKNASDQRELTASAIRSNFRTDLVS